MNRVLNTLKAVLKLETVEYKQMIALAAEKKKALFKNNVSELDLVVAREWTVLKRIKQLEAERETLIEKAAVLSHRQKSTMRLNDIIEMISGELRDEFIHIRDELSDVITQMKRCNEANRGLIETQLQYASFSVNLLSGQVGSLSTYSHAGQMKDKQEKATFLIDQSI